jgi:transposase
MITADSLPDDVATLKALVLAGQAAQLAAESKARNLEAEVRARTLLIEQMKFTIAKLKHEQHGQSSERASVLEQLELELADLEEDASEAEADAQLAAERAKAAKINVQPFERRRPARRPLPEDLPRERIVHPAPAHCPCCGGDRLRKIGEDVTETLELVPRQWKVIQHVREKFSCRACEAISQPPAPFHPISRGRAGPRLLAHILFAKYGLHLPLNRQSTTYAHEGVMLDVSTLADWVGAAAATLRPLVEAIKAHVLAGERIHADDTTVPVLAKRKTRTGRVWVYVRDDRPFAGHAPPAAIFFYSPDRSGNHPEAHLATYAGPMQADAYAGFNRLYETSRKPGPVIEVGCWAHARRKFFEIARLKKAPIAIEAVKQIDALFAIEREINGLPPHERKAARQARSRPLVDEFHTFLHERRAKLSGKSETAKAIDYSLKRWDVFTRRWPAVHDQQRRRTRAARCGRRPQELDIRRLRRWRPPCRRHLHPDPDRQTQRHRSANMARRRPRPVARSSGQQARRPAALELEAPRNPCRCLIAPINRPSARATPPVVFTGCVRRGGSECEVS